MERGKGGEREDALSVAARMDCYGNGLSTSYSDSASRDGGGTLGESELRSLACCYSSSASYLSPPSLAAHPPRHFFSARSFSAFIRSQSASAFAAFSSSKSRALIPSSPSCFFLSSLSAVMRCRSWVFRCCLCSYVSGILDGLRGI